MSEEILRALMELFALIVKQDDGILESERNYVLDFLEKQLNTKSLIKYLLLFEDIAGSPHSERTRQAGDPPDERDSVKILSICKYINQTLNKEQKVVVLLRLYELMDVSRRYTPMRLRIISTVSEVFRIVPRESEMLGLYVRNNEPENLVHPSILVLHPGTGESELFHNLNEGYANTKILILRIASVDLCFVKYVSDVQLYLNGIPIVRNYIYTFPKGSVLRSQHGHAFYYSDVISRFLSSEITKRISFKVSNVSYRLPGRQRMIAPMSFSASHGNLVGIMGGSGAGKTTLLNLMSGMIEPSTGKITLNGLDLYADKDRLEGVIGYIPQDDLLIEDLTVFENLYFAASQCFGSLPKNEITELTSHMLKSLGLSEKKDLRVGSVMNKIISGGQRKRLNIALELIREPSVLFIDEPTTGLSSKDSENIMDLLRDLTLKGKIVFTVIHQPSSDIFKMFDKVLILDQGGFMAYYGNPVDSVIYFKKTASQINAEIGECPSCGNVNPEIIFKILEAQVVDEFGRYTDSRKVKPKEWSEKFKSEQLEEPAAEMEEIKEEPEKSLDRPGKLKQYLLYLKRNLKSKLADRPYVILTLLEAPVLAFILASIIRYIPDPNATVYLFSENENIPVYIFMSIIVSAFLGLTLSAEEIFHDRKILRREQFLNLSRSSYLLSKVTVLMLISAVQSLLFVAVANPILEIRDLAYNYWLALFATSLCTNIIGLIISQSFNSVISIYIAIPLLLIPMMILSGAMFPFDKLNRHVTRIDKVPLIAEIMPTRWSYEALMVSQFRDNSFSSLKYNSEGETYYTLERKISVADFNTVHRIPELIKVIDQTTGDNVINDGRRIYEGNLALVSNELEIIRFLTGISFAGNITPENFNTALADSVKTYLNNAESFFRDISNRASATKDRFIGMNRDKLKVLESEHFNYKLEEVVTKYYEPDKILRFRGSFVQNTDPVYMEPVRRGIFDFRAHFFAPQKNFLGRLTNTFIFNLCVIFAGSVFLYLILYIDIPARISRNYRKSESGR